MSTDPSSTAPDVSVIIPHYEQRDALKACLASIAGQSLDAERFEVIVIDNNSSSDLADIKAQYPSFLFLSERRKGAAHARNAGMAAARGNAFAFIDADCIADKRWLETGLRALEKSDLVGGDVIVTTASAKSPTAVELFECVFAFRQRNYIKRKHFSVTANLFAGRDVAEAVGPFQNGISEDLDWCLRARTLGFRLAFNDTSIISHPARRTWDELTTKWDRLITERWNGFGGRSLIRRFVWAGLAVVTALSAAPHIAVVMFSGRVSGLGNKLAAAQVLTKIRFWRAKVMMAKLQPE